MQTANDKLSSTFSALADPTRRAILARLASGEASVSELAKPMKMTMPASDWVDQYRKFWEASFDRLDEYLKVLQAQNVSESVSKSGKRKKRI